MELITIASKNLFNKNDWNVIRKKFNNIYFVNNKEVESFHYEKLGGEIRLS